MIDLFQRNFDTDTTPLKQSATAATAEATLDLKLQLEEARQQGFDAGRDLGKRDAQEEFAEAEAERLIAERAAIREQLSALLHQDEKLRRDTERDIVELFLALGERLTPELLDTYSADLAVARIRESVERVRSDPVLSIHAAPDVIAQLQDETPEWLDDATQDKVIKLIADPEMSRGAAQVRWKGGRLEYDLNAAATAMIAALRQAADTYTHPDQKAG